MSVFENILINQSVSDVIINCIYNYEIIKKGDLTKGIGKRFFNICEDLNIAISPAKLSYL